LYFQVTFDKILSGNAQVLASQRGKAFTKMVVGTLACGLESSVAKDKFQVSQKYLNTYAFFPSRV
jgi:hypothetical protein